MAGLRKDVDRILKRLEADYDCTVRSTGKDHWRVTRPGHQPITMSRTPSDQRVLRNIEADVRKYLGIDLKKRG